MAAIRWIVRMCRVVAIVSAASTCGTVDAFAAEAGAPAKLVVGVNYPNISWETSANQVSILKAMTSARFNEIRVQWRDPASHMLTALTNIKQSGAHILLIVSPAFTGTPRPANAFVTWSIYGLSQIDLAATATQFATDLDTVKKSGVQLDAVELLNEIDWVPFNGDLPYFEPNKGQYISDVATLPAAEETKIVDGFRLYGKALSMLRSQLQSYPAFQKTLVVSAGLADVTASWAIQTGGSAIALRQTLQLFGLNSVLNTADVFGLHLYDGLNVNVGSLAASRALTTPQLSICGSSAVDDKSCWITEFGSPAAASDCDAAPGLRGQLISAFDLQAVGLGVGKVSGLFYYSWGGDANYEIWRCGALSEVGVAYQNLMGPPTSMSKSANASSTGR